MNYATRLRELLTNYGLLIAPGVFDGMSALLAKQAGFQLLYASGGAIARSAGYPDIGLLTMTEMCAAIEHIVSVTQLPVIADADTGFGNAINVRRTVQTYERIGVAGLHLEDQTFPKRCGHLSDKSLIGVDEMCHKIQVAKASVTQQDFIIIARTDAIAVEGFAPAIARAKAYHAAGADMLFVEAPENLSQIETIASELPGLKLINMFQGGKTPLVDVAQLKALGYHVVIIPSDLQRASIHAMQVTLQAIHQYGNSATVATQLCSFKERERIVATEDYLSV